MSKRTDMLGDSEVLRRFWDGPLKDAVLKRNGEKGPKFEEDLKRLLRGEMIPVVPSSAKGIV